MRFIFTNTAGLCESLVTKLVDNEFNLGVITAHQQLDETNIFDKKLTKLHISNLEDELKEDDNLIISLDYRVAFDKNYYYELIDKANKAKIHLIYFFSRAEKHLKHFQLAKKSKKIEKHIKSGSVNYCILRVNELYQTFLQFNRNTKNTKQIEYFLSSDSCVSFVDANDIAETFLATIHHAPPKHAKYFLTGSKSWNCDKIIKELNLMDEEGGFTYSRVNGEDIWQILDYNESWKGVFAQLVNVSDELSIISDDIETIRNKRAGAINQLIFTDFPYFSGKVLEKKSVDSGTYIRMLMENFDYESEEDQAHHIKASASESSSSEFSSCASTPIGSFEKDPAFLPVANINDPNLEAIDQPQTTEKEDKNPPVDNPKSQPKIEPPEDVIVKEQIKEIKNAVEYIHEEKTVDEYQHKDTSISVNDRGSPSIDDEETEININYKERDISSHRMPKAQAIKLRDKRPVWTKDDEFSHCMICESSFGLFRRRHHCRNCGRLCDKKCCNTFMKLKKLKYYSPVRVCTICVKEYKEYRKQQKRIRHSKNGHEN